MASNGGRDAFSTTRDRADVRKGLHWPSALLGAALVFAQLGSGCAAGGAGSSCKSDFDCGTGFFCGGSGVCQQSSVICKSFVNCGENQICASGVCVNGCRMAGCPPGQTCNRSLDQCVTLLPDESNGGTSGSGSSTSAGAASSGSAGQTGGANTSGGSTIATLGSGTSSGGATGTGTGGGAGSSTGTASGSSTGTTGAACTADTWANFAGTFFTAYCNECHNWTQATVAADPSVGTEMRNGFMPPRRSKEPTPQDLNRILTWIGCGEP
jgi:hypothetical protein